MKTNLNCTDYRAYDPVSSKILEASQRLNEKYSSAYLEALSRKLKEYNFDLFDLHAESVKGNKKAKAILRELQKEGKKLLRTTEKEIEKEALSKALELMGYEIRDPDKAEKIYKKLSPEKWRELGVIVDEIVGESVLGPRAIYQRIMGGGVTSDGTLPEEREEKRKRILKAVGLAGLALGGLTLGSYFLNNFAEEKPHYKEIEKKEETQPFSALTVEREDVDNDGKLDYIVKSSSPFNVSVSLETSVGKFDVLKEYVKIGFREKIYTYKDLADKVSQKIRENISRFWKKGKDSFQFMKLKVEFYDKEGKFSDEELFFYNNAKLLKISRNGSHATVFDDLSVVGKKNLAIPSIHENEIKEDELITALYLTDSALVGATQFVLHPSDYALPESLNVTLYGSIPKFNVTTNTIEEINSTSQEFKVTWKNLNKFVESVWKYMNCSYCDEKVKVVEIPVKVHKNFKAEEIPVLVINYGEHKDERAIYAYEPFSSSDFEIGEYKTLKLDKPFIDNTEDYRVSFVLNESLKSFKNKIAHLWKNVTNIFSTGNTSIALGKKYEKIAELYVLHDEKEIFLTKVDIGKDGEADLYLKNKEALQNLSRKVSVLNETKTHLTEVFADYLEKLERIYGKNIKIDLYYHPKSETLILLPSHYGEKDLIVAKRYDQLFVGPYDIVKKVVKDLYRSKGGGSRKSGEETSGPGFGGGGSEEIGGPAVTT